MLKNVAGLDAIELPFTSGVNEIAASNRIGLPQCLKMENFRLSEDGTRIMKRLGLTQEVTNFGEDVYGYTTYYDTADKFRQVAVCESKLWQTWWDTGGGGEVETWAIIHTFSSIISHPVKAIEIQDKIFIINEIDSRMIHHDDNDYQIGIDAPATLPTLATTADGNMAPGYYRYAITYARSGNYGCESNPIKSLIGSTVFTGSGLNDLTSGGSYTGNISKTIRVTISATGNPDKIKYSFNGGQFLYICDSLNYRIQ